MTLRIAVLSDLHVFEGSSEAPSAPSYIGTADAMDAPEKFPFAGLRKLIEDEKLGADILVCPGDMTNQAQPTALRYAWERLNNLKDWLGADHLIATNGNHDIDSRHQYNGWDAKGVIQSLEPRFPGLSEVLCDRYWARNFVVLELGEVRIALLNSAAFHGGGKDQKEEFEHGRISPHTARAPSDSILMRHIAPRPLLAVPGPSASSS